MTSGIIEISFTSLVLSICGLLVGVLFLVAKYYNNTIQDCIKNIRDDIAEDKKNQKENYEKDLRIFKNDIERHFDEKIELARISIRDHSREDAKTVTETFNTFKNKLDRINPKLLEKTILETFDK